MQIIVAGAGAGKTTNMANVVSNHLVPNGKVVFCIAFTNAAAEHIEKNLCELNGCVPDSIKVSTIHSFLYQEFIQPYYFLLYEKQYEHLSGIILPDDYRYKNRRIKDLDDSNILHITKIPEKAKYIVINKSSDRASVKSKRKQIVSFFSKYIEAIYLDEAQDIDQNIASIIEELDAIGIKVFLYGDPKQDLKGFGQFRKLINNSENVTYLDKCYRCPQLHLELSNSLVYDEEKQIADESNKDGTIDIVFESDVKDLKDVFSREPQSSLCYISSKHDRFDTHATQNNKVFNTLYHEIQKAIAVKWRDSKSELEICRAAYYVTESMLTDYRKTRNSASAIKKWISNNTFEYPGNAGYALLNQIIQESNTATQDNITIKSIESVKGLESDSCLFVLTSELAPYLFLGNTEDNKTKHLLYVALTRSLDHLTILVTKEVEEKYSKQYIFDFLKL